MVLQSATAILSLRPIRIPRKQSRTGEIYAVLRYDGGWLPRATQVFCIEARLNLVTIPTFLVVGHCVT